MKNEQQQHARATEAIVSVITQFLNDDSKEIPNFRDDLAREALWNAIQAARHARELVKRAALGQELAPLGYYLRDDELGDHVEIDRLPGGGIWIDPS